MSSRVALLPVGLSRCPVGICICTSSPRWLRGEWTRGGKRGAVSPVRGDVWVLRWAYIWPILHPDSPLLKGHLVPEGAAPGTPAAVGAQCREGLWVAAHRGRGSWGAYADLYEKLRIFSYERTGGGGRLIDDMGVQRLPLCPGCETEALDQWFGAGFPALVWKPGGRGQMSLGWSLLSGCGYSLEGGPFLYFT